MSFSRSIFTTEALKPGKWVLGMQVQGPNGIKLFLSVIYDFSYQARAFVRIGFQCKHSSSLQKIVNYGQKSFITLAAGLDLIKLVTGVIYK